MDPMEVLLDEANDKVFALKKQNAVLKDLVRRMLPIAKEEYGFRIEINPSPKTESLAALIREAEEALK